METAATKAAGIQDKYRKLIHIFTERLDSTLDASGGDILTRLAIMDCRNALLKYGGLWDVARCRKAIERLPGDLQATGFPDELLKPVRATCKRMVAALRRV